MVFDLLLLLLLINNFHLLLCFLSCHSIQFTHFRDKSFISFNIHSQIISSLLIPLLLLLFLHLILQLDNLFSHDLLLLLALLHSLLILDLLLQLQQILVT